MANETAYQILQNNVKDISDKLSAQTAILAAAQTDPLIISAKSIMGQLGGKPGWIDASGVYWEGSDASAQHATAQHQIGINSDIITNTQNSIADLKGKLKDANDAVLKYQNESPVVKSEIATAVSNAKAGVVDSWKSIALTVGVLVIIIFGLVILFKKKKAA